MTPPLDDHGVSVLMLRALANGPYLREHKTGDGFDAFMLAVEATLLLRGYAAARTVALGRETPWFHAEPAPLDPRDGR